MSKNWTQKLRVLQRDRNATVVCSVGPYDGEPVEYAPRYPTDREPWVIRSKTYTDSETGEREVLYRYSGRECHPVIPEGKTNADFSD